MSDDRDKEIIMMSMHLHEKLTRTMNSYQTWYNEFKALVEEYKISIVGAIGTIIHEGEI